MMSSDESEYTSADEKDGDSDSLDKIKRPDYLTGTSESSLIDDSSRRNVEHTSLSTLYSLTEKLNLSKLFPGKFPSPDKNHPGIYEENETAILESGLVIKILGYEVLERERRFTVYKVKVERPGHWGVEQIPNWYLYRRYKDFVKLSDGLAQDFPGILLPELPPKRWLGNNFDPSFIGKRISGLTKFLKGIMRQSHVLQNAKAVRTFLCLDNPPHRATSISSSRALYDCFEETVRELRIQLRRKEELEDLTNALKEDLSHREAEVDAFKSENEHLRKQKDALMKAFGNEDNSGSIFPLHSSSGNNSETASDIKSLPDHIFG